MTLLEVYNIFHDVVKYFPEFKGEDGKLLECKRLNSFAVVYNRSDINSENMGKDSSYHNKNYFYSRHWDQVEGRNPENITFCYPKLLVFEDTVLIKEPFCGAQYMDVNLSLSVMDIKNPNKDSPEGYCKCRVKEEIINDTRTLLLQVSKLFGEYKKVVFYSPDGSTFEKWVHKSVPDKWKDEGHITSYEEKETAGDCIITEGKKTQAKMLPGGYNDETCGTGMTFTIRLNACQPKFDVDMPFDISEIKPPLGCC